MLGGIVIANYITVTTDSETSIHRGKGHLFVKISQENAYFALVRDNANDC